MWRTSGERRSFEMHDDARTSGATERRTLTLVDRNGAQSVVAYEAEGARLVLSGTIDGEPVVASMHAVNPSTLPLVGHRSRWIRTH